MRLARVRTLFGLDGARWNEERVLERYELLYEAGLAPEAARDGGRAATFEPALGAPMASDHRRILATGLGRLRGKLKYRPVAFELLPAAFTLSALQRTVEAVTGVPLHKQNFRRVVERTRLGGGVGQFRSRRGRAPRRTVPLPPRGRRRRPRAGLQPSGGECAEARARHAALRSAEVSRDPSGLQPGGPNR